MIINENLNKHIGIALDFQSRTQMFGEFGEGTRNKKLDLVTKGSKMFYEVIKDKELVQRNESLYCSVKKYLEC